MVRIANFDYFKEMMEKVLLFKEIDQDGDFHLFEVGEGGNGARVVVEQNADLPQASKAMARFIMQHFAWKTVPYWMNGPSVCSNLASKRPVM